MSYIKFFQLKSDQEDIGILGVKNYNREYNDNEKLEEIITEIFKEEYYQQSDEDVFDDVIQRLLEINILADRIYLENIYL